MKVHEAGSSKKCNLLGPFKVWTSSRVPTHFFLHFDVCEDLNTMLHQTFIQQYRGNTSLARSRYVHCSNSSTADRDMASMCSNVEVICKRARD
jgi:hypothetical protein